MLHPRWFLAATLSSFLLSAGVAHAQWRTDGIPFCTATGNQASALMIPDGAGGALVVWTDYRNGAFLGDIYAQRINAAGTALWSTNGVAICTAAGNQLNPSILPDATGGVIIAWEDHRADWDIYAQRINASGAVQWAPNGIVVCNATSTQTVPTAATDGAGGAIVTWTDTRPGYGIYAQRINGSGVPQWAANGVIVCTGASENSTITADGSGGAVIAWQDYRTSVDIYAQRINASGVVQWTANGVGICVGVAGSQQYPATVTDGAAGAIIAWSDPRSGNFDVYAQRIAATGATAWTGNGVAVSVAAGDQTIPGGPALVSDGLGGALLTWHDARSGLHHIYAQHLNPNGTALWTPDGLAICTAANEQGFPSLISDNNGGAYVVWHDGRNSPQTDIYAQHVNSAGTIQWVADGIAVGNGAGSQLYPVLSSDGAGGLLIVWDDQRLGPDDLYIQRIENRFGLWGHPEPNVTSVADIRNDQGGKVKVNWKASDHDAFGVNDVTFYSVWRATDVAALASAPASAMVKSPHDVPRDFSGRAVWKQSGAQTTDYYWEWVGNEDAHNRTAYTFSASTRSDSTSQSQANTYFFVSAQTADPVKYFDSNVAGGHSVDNLAPIAPLALVAQRTGWSTVKLKWNGVHVKDLHNYTVYRASASGVTPVPINFLSNATDTVLTDSSAPTPALYYVVTATDVHGNQGQASNEAAVVPASGVADTPAFTTLTVLQNHPNPFSATTELEIGLPKASDVKVEVFDVGGRHVGEMKVRQVPAGFRRIALTGIDTHALASGVYFYRVSAGAEQVTRKMVIAR